MMYSSFEDEDLPKVNPNENLETISEYHLLSLFPIEKFQIRAEKDRDKGIDFHIELKKEMADGRWRYTNYQFAVQLKATNTVQQSDDGSFGFQLFTSNINYLLNNPMPAYYIFYHHPTKAFFYENAKNLALQLQHKNLEWQKQQSHKIYFTKKLDQQAVQHIYDETYAHGNTLKHINLFINPLETKNNSDRLIIDADLEVYSVAQNIEFIDQFGADLVNNNRFNTVIEIEKRSWPRDSATPRFYLFCGIAYYQRGNLFKALELLNEAKKLSGEFDRQGQAIIEHTILSARYLLDMITKDDFDLQMEKINSLVDAGSFFQIEKAFETLSLNRAEPAAAIRQYYDTMKKIIENEKSSFVRIVAYNKIIEAESSILLHDLAMNFTFFMGRAQRPFNSRAYLEWLQLERKFMDRLHAIEAYANKCGYQMGGAYLTLVFIKWNYEKAIHIHYLGCWNKRNFDLLKPVNGLLVQMLEKICGSLDHLSLLYQTNDYIENMISSMILKFQIQHFSGKFEIANDTKNKIFHAIDKHGFQGLKKEYETIFNKGTAHESFVEKYTILMNKLQDSAVEKGFDPYRILSEKEINYKTAWSIKDFFQLDFSILPPEQKI
ncbi:DUF4365 domain-containing protein [Flavobacterium johnsoniae]|uniref:DUF4365 domain-containing protein n=1 Tax=Flavobacterium johnsoniae TaxID=986 RepID=A0A1M5QSM7_FLAJO|nr:DUF4365 domain-containing protein [Flavobacterium johnsoniae]SHH17137.1 protein of unknown function [Flavobacterium johnsoniae]